MNYENEITVEVNCSIEELKNILEINNFKLNEEYDLIDFYLIKKDYDINLNDLEILKQCILLRRVVQRDKETKKIMYKYKEYDINGDILKQGKIDCEVKSLEDAQAVFEALGYIKLIEIKDHISVFANEMTELAVQEVNDKHLYIEIEDSSKRTNKVYNNIEEMKGEISKYKIPIKSEDYFIKKAVIELNERNI